MKESELIRRIQISSAHRGARLFRNNTALGWAGKAIKHPGPAPMQVVLYPGDVLIRGGYPIHAGLCVGSSDIIGWTRTERGALFTAIEVKASRGASATAEQSAFLEAVRAAGGISGIARTEDDADRIIGG